MSAARNRGARRAEGSALAGALRARRGSGSGVAHRVLVLAPGAPAVQILVPAMRALEGGKLVRYTNDTEGAVVPWHLP